jgi:hypothetical protein
MQDLRGQQLSVPRARVMADYRVYCLDGAGRIALADWIEASDDDDAIAKARKLKPNANSCEVWQKGRLVAKLSSAGRLERVDTAIR